MSSSKWVLAVVVVIVVVLGGLWYTGNLPMVGGDQSAAVASTNSFNIPAVVSAANLAVADISAGVTAKSDTQVRAAADHYRLAVNALQVLYPQLKSAVEAATARNANTGGAPAALQDYAVKMTYLQSTTLTLVNGPVSIKNLNAVIADVATINSALQSIKTK